MTLQRAELTSEDIVCFFYGKDVDVFCSWYKISSFVQKFNEVGWKVDVGEVLYFIRARQKGCPISRDL